ncbi:hypothetical protein ILUMI_00327 [Ignelater luminosus]|uniref:Uncharacterized protein n=1 Tax=Ignelater luminosus TaxID=2038154 RepID=A0A8K0DGH0_IGNLU|nr:hypothetical protein ILUMI_00327 [Ignelater luminosus]
MEQPYTDVAVLTEIKKSGQGSENLGVYAINDDLLVAGKEQFFQQPHWKKRDDDTIGKYGKDTLNDNAERIKEQQIQEDQYEQIEERRHNLMSLEHDSVQRLYRGRMDNRLQRMNLENTEKHYRYFKDAIHQAAYEALGIYEKNNNERKPYWWNEKIEIDIESKKKAFQKYLSTKSIQDKIRYKEARSKVREKFIKQKVENPKLEARKEEEGRNVQ